MTPTPRDIVDTMLASVERERKTREAQTRMMQAVYMERARRMADRAQPKPKEARKPAWWLGVLSGLWGILWAVVLWLAWDGARIVEQVMR